MWVGERGRGREGVLITTPPLRCITWHEHKKDGGWMWGIGCLFLPLSRQGRDPGGKDMHASHLGCGGVLSWGHTPVRHSPLLRQGQI